MEYRVRLTALSSFVLIVAAAPLCAQNLPGNASLSGQYYVRYLGDNANCTVGGLITDCPLSFSGVFTFDGKGGFTVTSGQGIYNNGSDHTLTTLTTGSYTVWSSGEVSMTNPFDTSNNGTTLYGGVGQGALVASSTDSLYPDMLVAIPVATSATTATLSGTYQVADLEFNGGSFLNNRNTLFTMTSNGSGSLGNITVNGTASALNDVNTTQTISGATYTLSANGSGTMNLPAPSGVTTANQLIAGQKTVYVSADGSFLVGGSPSGYDIIVAAKAPTGSAKPAFSGIYFTTELENYTGGGQVAIYAGQGASNELGDSAGDELDHQRINPDGYQSYDLTYNDNLTFNAAGVNTTAGQGYQSAVSGDGRYAFLVGTDGDYFLEVYAKGPAITAPASGPFIYPTGVVNAASNSPFTAQISPGEVITLYGTNLATSTATASAPFPTTLGGAQVLINGTAVPIYYASANQISAVVPYNLTGNTVVLTVQVSVGGTTSNTVFTYGGVTSAGVFTVPVGGLGDAAALHADYSLVSESSPAKVGEVIAVYLTGLGTVTPTVTAGAPAPNTTQVDNPVDVYIDGVPATVQYAGLAPTLGGLYQINVVIPSGVTTGTDVTLEISAADSDNIQATIPISK